MKKIVSALTVLLASYLPLASQAATDGFIVPLDEDLTKAISAAPAATASAAASSVKQGAWIEVTSSNKSLIRDIATGKKKGYEFDNSHFISMMNWWFWGDISPSFHLDAEIAVWDFDKTLYQANSYATSVPDVTWGDGLQTLASMPFSFLYNANDEGVGNFNKMGFTVVTPYVQAKIGYGDLKANGMLDFEGIYHVIDRWDFVDKGFTEISLGKNLQTFGNITLNATAAFSMMRGTYGLYDLLDIKYGDEKNPLVEAAFTFGSETTEEELFRYNEQNTNALSAYLALSPLEQLKLEGHAIASFGTDIDLDKDALAVAGRAAWSADKWSVRLMDSYACQNVDSVWGSDGADYDNIRANNNATQLDFNLGISDAVSFGLDETALLVLNDVDGGTKHNEFKDFMRLRNQPYMDLDLSSLLNTDLSVGLYGVLNLDRPTDSTKGDKDWETVFKEAGIELKFQSLPFAKKLTFDYVLSANAEWEMESSKIESNNNYDVGELFHSVMLTADMNDLISLTAGFLYRNYLADTSDSFVEQNLGLALGMMIHKTPLPGHPKFWIHATYGMDPYEDTNYNLFRADDGQNKAIHRTYLLNTLDDTSDGANVSSYVRLGLIWDL